MLSKVSFWKAVLFSIIALVAALVIGYAVYAGNEAFPEGEPTLTIEETSSYEESIQDTSPEYPE